MAIFSKLMSIILVFAALCGLYSNDSNDTQEAYMAAIESVGYENTVETAIPQTDIYNMVVSHFDAPLAEGKTEKKAVIIGYDGCRADALSLMKDEDASAIRKMISDGASLNLAYCGGVNYPDGENTQATSTAPGWCAVLTGVWADKNGVYGNGQPKNMEYKTLMTELVEDGTIDSAAFNTIWKGHFVDDDSTYGPEKKYCEDNNLNVEFNRYSSDYASTIEVCKQLSMVDCPDFMIAIYERTDSAGHNTGFSINNPIYKMGFENNDRLALETIKAIENRDTYESEDWLIILTSDHGGYGKDHGKTSIQERMVFIVSNK